MEVKPLAKYRVRLAFDMFRVGAILQPTGLWRDHLLSKGLIERVEDEAPAEASPPAGGGAEPEKRKRGRPRKVEA